MNVFPLRAGGSCGVEVADIDLRQATQDEILKIGRLAVENLVLVIRGQSLEPEDELRICEMIGPVEHVSALNRCPIGKAGHHLTGIQRVTGRRHPDGSPMGLFGHDHDLDWHANRPSADKERKPLIWLYSVEGTKGTRTSWANCSAAYHDLDSSTRMEIDDLLGIYGFEPGRYTSWNEWKSHRNLDGIPFVQTIPATGRKGFYFPYLQLFGFKDKSDEYSAALIEKLRAHLLQDKYIYHHDWQDGDIVISEQWLTIHKRWACDTSHRTLHRISFGYDNVDFSLKREWQNAEA